MITNPVTCGPDATIGEVDELCARYRISGLPVVSPDGVLLGIITNRDIRFEQDRSRSAGELMTKMPLVTAPVGVSRQQALRLLSENKIEKLPLVDAHGLLREPEMIQSDQAAVVVCQSFRPARLPRQGSDPPQKRNKWVVCEYNRIGQKILDRLVPEIKVG